MIVRRLMIGIVSLCVLGTAAWGVLRGIAAAQKELELKEERSGTVVGVLVAKTESIIDVKADGEERPRRYVPEWKGGSPAQGGGFDKEMLKIIKELKVGSRVRLEWKFDERPRVVKIEVLKAPAEKGK